MRPFLTLSFSIIILACLFPAWSTAFEADDPEADYSYIRFWEGDDPLMKMSDLVAYCAPIFWMSPDEPELHNKRGKNILIPTPFPFDKPANQPVIYYQVREIIVSDEDSELDLEIDPANFGEMILDLSRIHGFDIDYNHYYRFESGLGGHDHDTEQAQFKIYVNNIEDDNGLKTYQLYLLQVTAKAHALMWYDNIYKVSRDNLNTELELPFHIFVEEGKHASCNDMNADGYYTPGYDVNVRRNDAWGLRDVIRTGALFSPQFKGWMAKIRQLPHRVFPPLPADSPHRAKHSVGGEYAPDNAIYELRPMPSPKEAQPDNALANDMKSYYSEGWPHLKSISGTQKFFDWWESDNFINSLAFAFRMNDVSGFSFSFPLLFVKNVEAPLVGGWLVNRIYLQDTNFRDFGYNILYTPSASRFLDGYFSFGLEVDQFELAGVEEIQQRTDFVYEAGVKVRGNVAFSPLRFLGVLTNFWGVRLGVKAVGFMQIDELSYVFEIGAGVW